MDDTFFWLSGNRLSSDFLHWMKEQKAFNVSYATLSRTKTHLKKGVELTPRQEMISMYAKEYKASFEESKRA